MRSRERGVGMDLCIREDLWRDDFVWTEGLSGVDEGC